MRSKEFVVLLDQELETIVDSHFLGVETYGYQLLENKVRKIRKLLLREPLRSAEIKKQILELAHDVTEPSRSRLRALAQDLTGLPDPTALPAVPSAIKVSDLQRLHSFFQKETLSNRELRSYLKSLLNNDSHPGWLEHPKGLGCGSAQIQCGAIGYRLNILPDLVAQRASRSFTSAETAIQPRFPPSWATCRAIAAWDGWHAFALPESEDHQVLLESISSLPSRELEQAVQGLATGLRQLSLDSLHPYAQPNLRAIYLDPIQEVLNEIASMSSVSPPTDIPSDLPFSINRMWMRNPRALLKELESDSRLATDVPQGTCLVHGNLGFESILWNSATGQTTVVDQGLSFHGDYLFDLARLISSVLLFDPLLNTSDWQGAYSAPEREYAFSLERNQTHRRRAERVIGELEKVIQGSAERLESQDKKPQERTRAAFHRLLLALAHHFFVALPYARSPQESAVLFGAGTLLLNLYAQDGSSGGSILPSNLLDLF